MSVLQEDGRRKRVDSLVIPEDGVLVLANFDGAAAELCITLSASASI